ISMKKRVLCLVILAALSVSGCGKIDENSSTTKAAPTENVTTPQEDSRDDSPSDSDEEKSDSTELFVKGKELELSRETMLDLLKNDLSYDGIENKTVDLMFDKSAEEEFKNSGIYLNIDTSDMDLLRYGNNEYDTDHVTVLGNDEGGYYILAGSALHASEELVDSLYELAGISYEKPEKKTEGDIRFEEGSQLWYQGREFEIEPSQLMRILVQQIAEPDITRTMMNTIFTMEDIENYKQSGFYAQFTSEPGNDTGVDGEVIAIRQIDVAGSFDEGFLFSINGGSLMMMRPEYVQDILDLAGVDVTLAESSEGSSDTNENYISRIAKADYDIEFIQEGRTVDVDDNKHQIGLIVFQSLCKGKITQDSALTMEMIESAKNDPEGAYGKLTFKEAQKVIYDAKETLTQQIEFFKSGDNVGISFDGADPVKIDDFDRQEMALILYTALPDKMTAQDD
ncbi:MAG: hypothetical protein IJ129_00590, partial [Ruminococcus sp.]|nr:hypothetical protein [Ruminococcus sp.]